MFSSITMASSTTKPMERISAIMEMLFRLKLSRYITANVPRMEKGSASAGIRVAETLRRNRKITMITSASVAAMVNWISLKASRIVRSGRRGAQVHARAAAAAWNVGSRR